MSNSPDDESRIETLEREVKELKGEVQWLKRMVGQPSRPPIIKAIGKPFPKKGEPNIPIIEGRDD